MKQIGDCASIENAIYLNFYARICCLFSTALASVVTREIGPGAGKKDPPPPDPAPVIGRIRMQELGIQLVGFEVIVKKVGIYPLGLSDNHPIPAMPLNIFVPPLFLHPGLILHSPHPRYITGSD